MIIIQHYSRLFLGILFIMSSLGKVTDVAGFSVAVSDYQILPALLVHPFAFLLAWAELACGLAFLFGFARKVASAAAALMMVTFITAITVSMARGLDIDCGCFDMPLFGSPKAGWHTIIRNLFLLAMAVAVYKGAAKPQPVSH